MPIPATTGIERLVLALAALVPQRAKSAFRGNPGSPRRTANLVHSILNALPVERYPVVPCRGVLRGCQMRLDWRRHRAFAYGTWEEGVLKAMLNTVSSGKAALDIGANIGF